LNRIEERHKNGEEYAEKERLRKSKTKNEERWRWYRGRGVWDRQWWTDWREKREKNSGKGEKLENKIRSMDIGKKTWRKASEIDARDPAPESNN